MSLWVDGTEGHGDDSFGTEARAVRGDLDSCSGVVELHVDYNVGCSG